MQLTLDGRTSLAVKLDTTIAFLREYEPKEGYYLAFSGGKDSVALLQCARLAGVTFDAQGRVVMARHRWRGPDAAWAEANGFHTLPPREDGEQLSLF